MSDDNKYGIKEIIEAMETRLNARMDTIISLQEKTNGRVRALEMWRSALVGAMGLLTIIGIPEFLTVITNSI